jgi:hypothetical protein
MWLPTSAHATANARPIPRAPPVMTVTRSFRENKSTTDRLRYWLHSRSGVGKILLMVRLVSNTMLLSRLVQLLEERLENQKVEFNHTGSSIRYH